MATTTTRVFRFALGLPLAALGACLNVVGVVGALAGDVTIGGAGLAVGVACTAFAVALLKSGPSPSVADDAADADTTPPSIFKDGPCVNPGSGAPMASRYGYDADGYLYGGGPVPRA